MKKSLLGLIALSLLFISTVSARQVPTVPDLSNPAWKLVDTQQGQDIAEGIKLFSSRYNNDFENRKAYLIVSESNNVKENLVMLFGDKNSPEPWVALRADDGKWYVSRTQGMDIVIDSLKDANGQNIGVKITLETAGGLKEKKIRTKE